MKNDVTAESWQELQAMLYNIDKTEHHRYRSNYVCRGVDDQDYGLETSLQRIG